MRRFRGEHDMNVETQYYYGWVGSNEDIRKLEDAAKRITDSSLIDWEMDVTKNNICPEKFGDMVLTIVMYTFDRDTISSSEHFKKTLRLIEDESGVKFEEEA